MPYLLIGGKEMLEEVKVGGTTYEIVLKELEADSGVQFGWFRADKCIIELNERINPQKIEQTFIHEMLHAIFHEVGLDQLEDEETIVNRASLMLHQVLRDNDFSWLRKGEETTRIVAGDEEYIMFKNVEVAEVD